jgi:hypothetical protein
MKRHIYAGILGVIFIIIAAFQFHTSYQFRIEPPSKDWSKEVLVSEGKVKTPKACKIQ